jgi:hypothetical protein
MFAPLEGWRHVKVTDRHTALDYAQVLKELQAFPSFNVSSPMMTLAPAIWRQSAGRTARDYAWAPGPRRDQHCEV